MSIVKLAEVFCVAAHAAVGQLRKYTFTDYHVHPMEVLAILRLATEVDDEMRCAALLHDTIEDTQVKARHIAMFFGEGVASLVLELSDISKPEDGNREERKRIDREHTARASRRAKTIKLCDLISNSKSITEYDEKFAKIYMREKRLLLEVLQDGDPILYAMAKEIVDKYYLENPDVA